MLLDQTQTDQITLTSAAAGAVRELLAKRNLEGYALRIFVSGGGCSGYQYGMALEGNVRDNDLVYEQHDVKLVVDEISINYLRGSTVDYVDEIMGSGFKIDNPNAVASCGCGSSFRTKEEADAGYDSGGGCGCH
ncbi:MAG TPA: iron-sulfur cluster insertion protein ErpA [Anaerolineales bacterium]|jgi:iron-sulfur cluster assembly protein|nr:iron-sulfur cluster insertion protein ErpA [Anaerolineales bacterium]